MGDLATMVTWKGYWLQTSNSFYHKAIPSYDVKSELTIWNDIRCSLYSATVTIAFVVIECNFFVIHSWFFNGNTSYEFNYKNYEYYVS